MGNYFDLQHIIEYSWVVLMCLVGGAIVFSYFSNLYKVIQRLNRREVSFMTLIRILGVFFPLVGIVMGVVKEEKQYD